MAQREAPDGVFSFLDTDLYKLSMQCAVLKYFSKIEVEYAFTNRTPDMKLSKEAFFMAPATKSRSWPKSPYPQEELDFLKHKMSVISAQNIWYI